MRESEMNEMEKNYTVEPSVFEGLVQEHFGNNLLYIDQGDHGEVFASDDYALKIMKKNNVEIDIMSYFQDTNPYGLIPEVFHIGIIDGNKAIFRENIMDIEDSIYHDSLFSMFTQYCRNAEILLYGIISLEEFEKRKTELIKQWGSRDEDNLDLRDLIDFHDFLKKQNILLNDMHIGNFGIDKNGNVKIRDFSYCLLLPDFNFIPKYDNDMITNIKNKLNYNISMNM